MQATAAVMDETRPEIPIVVCPLRGEIAAESCRSRQARDARCVGCLVKSLDEATASAGPEPVPAPEAPPVAEEPAAKKPPRFVVCAECGKTKHRKARGLCNPCYERLRSAGLLDAKYPAKPWAGGHRRKPADTPTVRPCRRCGQTKHHKGRGLCNACYSAEAYHGELDNWPPLRNQGMADAENETPQRPTLPLTFEGADLALYRRLCDAARRERRIPEQQALWYLEQALGNGN